LKSKVKSIWLLSAYRSDSHASWADWLVETFTQFHWHKFELPGRHFRWRIRGNPLSWLYQFPEEAPDLILATSMVDLATIKGLHPRLATVPCVYYFHENQFSYPVSKHQVDSIEPMMVQLYGAIAAEKSLFNSVYNRDSFLEGVGNLLDKFPDSIPEGIVNSLKNKCNVLPVAIHPIEHDEVKDKSLILWNHRWEYDKDPEVFCDALIKLSQIYPDFKLALLGSRPKIKPDVLLKIEDMFADKILVNDKVPIQEYKKYLGQSSIVVSTAIHEFQGLSVLEAISAGAVPVVPDSLCYREQYDEIYRYESGSSVALADMLVSCLNNLPESPDVSNWYSKALVGEWDKVLRGAD